MLGQPTSTMAAKWKGRRTLIDLYTERDQTRWYWRCAATLSAFIIMSGFIVFPSTFNNASGITVNQNNAGILAIVLLAVGYTLSVALWFTCHSWLFQLDVIFLPCLSMCIFGLLNIIYNLKFHQESDHQKPSTSLWSSSSISALALATISSVIYTILALLTYRKIHIVRMRDAKHRHTPDSEHAQLITEDEQQRRQLMRLLREHDAGRGVSPEASLSTFRIDLPEELRRSNTLLSTPDSIYEARSRLHTPISDRPVHPSMTQPIPHLFPNPFVNQNLQVQHFDPSFAPRPINMGSDYFVRGADAVPHNNDAGKPNTGYPTEKAEKVYGSSMLLVDGEQHPLERKRAHYHFETVEEQERRGRSANRENRRTEIEMGSRITSKGRAEIGIGSQNTVKDKAEIERVVVTPRIARVETDGWAPRLETASR